MLYTAFKGDVTAIQWCQLCVSRSGTFFSYLRVLVRIRNFYNSGRYLARYVLDRLFDNLTDKSY